MTQSLAISLIEQAPTAKALFIGGPLPETVYKNLARLCHPDVVTEVPKARAEQAFKKLGAFYAEITGKKVSNSVVIAGYAVERAFAKGDICDLYMCSDLSGKSHNESILKIAQSPKDNDLVGVEAATLTKLHHSGSANPFSTYLPVLIKTLKASGRQANILSQISGCYSLTELKAIFPIGLDFRHIVWMGNRLWSALGYVHRHQVIHGAILPEHLLYYSATHGLRLVDWCYSVETGKPLVARVKHHADQYPPEVARKMAAIPSTDIYMAAKALKGAADSIPKSFRPLFEHCLAESPYARPPDAWELQDMWKTLAVKEYGQPKFLELKIPAH